MSTQITDPADRLGWARDGSGREFVEAIEKRYGTAPITIPDFAERYTNVCDLIVQLLWPERYGVRPDDPFMNTSDPAREIARLFFRAAGLEPEAEP
jgi:hypothetical protein